MRDKCHHFVFKSLLFEFSVASTDSVPKLILLTVEMNALEVSGISFSPVPSVLYLVTQQPCI